MSRNSTAARPVFARVCIRVFALVGAALSFAPAAARADDSSYCRKVQARAASDASLLIAPTVTLQGIRFPVSGPLTDVGPMTGSGYQFRAGVAFSPLDVYRGLRVLRAGDADCRQHGARADLEDALLRGTDGVRLTALDEQARFLDAHRADWSVPLARAEERLAARVITLSDLDEMRRLADDLERKRLRARAAVQDLAAAGLVPGAPSGSLVGATARYFREAARYEDEVKGVRALDAWQFQLSGGAVPMSTVDWYGLVHVTFNFGAFERMHEDAVYAEARADEIRNARHEIGARVRELRARAVASLDAAKEELEVATRAAAFVVATEDALEKADARNIVHVKDALAIQQVSIESDRVFLRAFIGALTAFLEDSHG
jgi:hypothetical protein